MFCSKACRSKDFHQILCVLCQDGYQSNFVEKMVYGTIRIMESESAALKLISEQEKKTVFDFDLSKPESKDYETKMLKIVNSLSKTTTVDSENSSYDPRMRLFHHFHKIANINSFEFAEFSYGAEKLADVMGSGIFAFASLLNHSCYPNVIHAMVEGKMVLIVARPIKAGEQIFITYGPLFSIHDISMRQARLSLYGFDCDCIACANKYPRKEDLVQRDRNFIKPSKPTDTQNAILQFKKNCAYINKQSTLPPSFEVSHVEIHNMELLDTIARRTLKVKLSGSEK